MDPRLVVPRDLSTGNTATTESTGMDHGSNNHARILLAEEQDVMDDDDDDDDVRDTVTKTTQEKVQEDDDDEELQDAPLPTISNDGTTKSGDGSAAASIATTQQQLLQQHLLLHRDKLLQPLLLHDRIIMPSPYPQHNTGTSRFRTAFSRILQDSFNDIEAWQAVMTEASACDSAIFDKSSLENYTKLDWVESCYGALLHRFPYSTTHIIGAAELLLQQVTAISKVVTALSINNSNNTSRHPLHITSMKQRSIACHTKLQHLFHVYLGTDLTIGDENGTGTTVPPNQHSLPMCAWVVELWMLYIRMVQHDSSAATATSTVAAAGAADPHHRARDAVTAAFDMAVTAAGDAYNNHVLWKAYIEFVQSWTLVPQQQSLTSPVFSVDHGLVQRQMVQLRSIYQRAVTFPMTGLDTLWQEYENFEKQQSEALAAALIQELSPKYQQARSVYLERIRVLNTGDLQRGRLATPPVSTLENTDEDYHNKLLDEYNLLRVWKTRCSYERTNPGRLSLLDLSKRVRSTFTEMACTLTRHPETWHMWSTWELIHGGPNAGIAASGNDATVANGDPVAQLSPAAAKAVIVLQLGQEHIPDSTLLAYSEAQIYEAHHVEPRTCCTVLEKFLLRSPNTLGFVLYQQLVRRYEGKEQARAVFTRARKTLSTSNVIMSAKKAKVDSTLDNVKVIAEIAETDKVNNDEDFGKRKMVTNRLDASVGVVTPDVAVVTDNRSSKTSNAGPITWHLYAAHAVLEHRQNRAPDIAARVYELGLRKHATFLTVPSYIQRYAHLLLELNDMMNLRALLTRAVAACEIEKKQDSIASLWDMTLYFESVGGSGTPSIASLQAIEKRRHEALFGPEFEDVATGGIVGIGDSVLIGPQKSSIAEQLIRDEGYEISSRIVSGLSRTVDVLNVMGLWGSGRTESRSRRTIASADNQLEFSGGQSDASFMKRLMFEKMTHAGISPENAMVDAGVGSKILTARERLAGPGGVGGGTAIMLAIQQSPDWLRPLLLLLPASHSRLPIVAKPPPHLTEMALSTLRQNELPAERPPDDKLKGAKRSLSAANGGNSSDEDDAGAGASGYGNAFRVRQRARMIENGTDRL